MAVEILILSGARQGERLVFDKREFKVGSDAGCEVLFDSDRDPSIRGRSAMFRCQEDGWHVRCAGGDVLVNQRTVTGWMRVRSGDVVRMSQLGPDFSFSLVTSVSVSESAGGRTSTPVIESAPRVAAGCESAATGRGGRAAASRHGSLGRYGRSRPTIGNLGWRRHRGCDRGLGRWAIVAFATNDCSQRGPDGRFRCTSA